MPWTTKPPYGIHLDPANPINIGLPLDYTANEGAGTTVHNSALTPLAGDSGTFSSGSLTWATTPLGVTFPAGDFRIDSGTTTAGMPASPTAAWALETWVAITAGGAPSLAAIWGFGSTTLPAQGINGSGRYFLTLGGSAPFHVYFWGVGADWDSGIPWIADGAPHQYVFTTPGGSATPTISLYVDGTLRASGVPSAALVTAATGGLSEVAVGSHAGGGTGSFPGEFIRGRIWSRELSATEIATSFSGTWNSYGPPTLQVTAKVMTSGRAIGFLIGAGHWQGDAWHSIAADPTIRVNGGAPIQLSGHVANGENPWVIYPLASKINPTDVVTYTAPDSWLTAQSGPAAGATNGVVINLSGQDMSPLPPVTMRVGFNIRNLENAAATQLFRNMRKRCQNMVQESNLSVVLPVDANFNVTSIPVGDHAISLLMQGAGNGMDDLNHPQAPGIYPLTWEDYTVDGSADPPILKPDPSAVAIVTPSGPKQTLSGGPGNLPFVFRQPYNIQPVGGGASCGLNTYLRTTVPYPTIRNIRVAIPGDDPDSTKITSDSFLSRFAGARCLRFMFGGEGVGSNVATYAQARKTSHVSCDGQASQNVQVSSVAAISGGAVQWNSGSYPVTDSNTAFGAMNNVAVLRFTTSAPHPFYTGQHVGIGGLTNQTFSGPGGTRDGVQVVGSSGSQWAHVSGGWLYAVDETHFDLLAGSVGSSGPNIPDMSLGPQTFDITGGQSSLGTQYPSTNTCSPEEQVKVACEMGSPAKPCALYLHLGDAMTDACCASIGQECLDAWQAMGSPSWLEIYVEWSNEAWNFEYLSYTFTLTMGALGVAGAGAGYHKTYAYIANRATSAFKSIWTAAGHGDRVKQVLACQFGDPGGCSVILQYASEHGYAVDAVADAPYIGIGTWPRNAWDGLDAEQRHDLWEWLIQYGTIGPGSAPQVTGVTAFLAQYYPNAKLIGYEGGIDVIAPDADQPATEPSQQRTYDFFYHQRMYRLTMIINALIQGWGYWFYNKFAAEGFGASGRIPYGCFAWPLQQPGRGLNNIVTAGKPANVNLDSANQSPVGQAMLDWNSGIIPTPTPTPTPSRPMILVSPEMVIVIA